MCKVNPEHAKNVRVGKRGRKVLYMKVLCDIYGCIDSALQWYKIFTGVLQEEGFVLNPYDKCIVNKIINGKQCSISWHVDNCFATHVSKKVLKGIASKMIEHFDEMPTH